MPTWITPRRLGATAVLYAVFLGGWYLGQPLPGVGCHAPEPTTALEGPDRIREPGDTFSDLSGAARTAQQVVTAEVVDTDAIVPCDGTSHARLVAWATGDWR
ncbi:hypothetical protein [Streptomyces sp. NRRL F-5135]|uniref:hypothetical protein n=1 Tax=Streptomyces sp. NRRL F-5135 TaxID=1463858 RepID=UPI0004C7BB72|nr:hypothetical protein [Streptomyces sp. NRRL F-5135]